MEHTWQTHHLPKLETSNVDGGDIALCGAFAEPSKLLAELDVERIAFVAPLACRSDLEWLLRGLHLHPNVRHVVVGGGDATAVGESLVDLWRHGLDATDGMPGGRGRLSPELDSEAVDALRADVVVHDWRGQPHADLGAAIPDIPVLSPERAPRELPHPVVPTRKVFLSRKTSFPIFSSDVGDAWLQLLNLVLRIGTEKQSSGGERFAEALNAVVTIEPPVDEDGVKRQQAAFPSFFEFSAQDLENLHAPEFAAQLCVSGGLDPIDAVCERLRKSHDTRRGTLVFTTPVDAGDASLLSATFNVVEERLYGTFVQRAADVYTDWPLDAMALVALQHGVSERIGLDIGSTTFVVHSAHLHDRDWARSEATLKESFKRPLPLQIDPSGVFLFGNDGGKARAMLLNHDASTIFWEDAFPDPEDLSWYIVDVMPWLLPQHIRYVGQECAALMRAMQAGECYLQG